MNYEADIDSRVIVEPWKPELCINPDHKEPQPVRARGLCHNCYMSEAKAVARGEFTWEQFERAGKCKPLKRTRTSRRKSWLFDFTRGPNGDQL